jgi:hypothetical protein
LGIPVKVTDPNSWGIPNIGLSQNLTSFGNPTSSPFLIDDKYYEWVDNFSWVKGKHSLRFGGEYRYNEFPQLGNEFPRGQFYYDNRMTQGYTPTSATSAQASGGYTGADFMLGYTYDAIIAVALAQADFRDSEWAAYIDDTWRVNPHLTLSLGFRWEVLQPLLDAKGLEPNIQLQQPLPSVANVSNLALHPVYVRTGGSGNFYDGINFRYMPYWQGAGAASGPPLQTVRDGRMGSRLINTNYHWCPANGLRPVDKPCFCCELRRFLPCRDLNGRWPGNPVPRRTTMVREPGPNRILSIAGLSAGSRVSPVCGALWR